jgi:hypothetical protein
MTKANSGPATGKEKMDEREKWLTEREKASTVPDQDGPLV